MGELRWSLQEVEHSWMECKEDCIRFTERINTAEREVHTNVCFLSAVSFLYSFVYLSSCPYLALPVAWLSRVGCKYPGAAWAAGSKARITQGKTNLLSISSKAFDCSYTGLRCHQQQLSRVVMGVVVGIKVFPLKRAFFEKSRTLSSSFWLHQQWRIYCLWNLLQLFYA